MCLNPIEIQNKNRGHKKTDTNFWKDLESQYIYVPCGHCSQCIALAQMYLVQRVQMECMVSHPFFCTLTYNNEKLPVLTTSTGYDFRYADIHDLQNMFKRIRNNNLFGRPFKYFATSERGTLKHRPHIHLLWFLPKYKTDTRMDILNLEQLMYKTVLQNWVTNVGSDKKPIYEPNCTFVRKMVAGKLKYNYDLHYCDSSLTNGGITEVGFYVLKYMLKKESYEQKLQQALRLNLDEDEYKDTYQRIKSRWHASKGFGLGTYDKETSIHPDILKYLKKCIDRTPSDLTYPCFYNPTTGQQFPMAPFYKNNGEIFPAEEAVKFYKRINPYDFKEHVTPAEYEKAVHEFNRIRDIVEKHNTSKDLELLYND